MPREAGTNPWSVAQVIASQLEAQITGLTDGTPYEARVRRLVSRSDGTGTDIESPWSEPSNQERPVRDTLALTYSVADTRTGTVISPRSEEKLTPRRGEVISMTNAMHRATDGRFFVLDVDRHNEYARAYNVVEFEL